MDVYIIIIIMLYSDWELHDMSWMIEWEHEACNYDVNKIMKPLIDWTT